mgnify:CR=1 FL=1
MALTNFIPQVWSARLLENLSKNHVFANLASRDYQGDILRAGDRVKINSIGRVTIGTYTKNTDIGAPETLSDAQTTLIIDQSKYFNFQIDDIDAAQQNPKIMDGAMWEAAYGLSEAADQYLAGLYTQGQINSGSDANPVVYAAAGDAYEQLVELATKLDEANVPKRGRWVVVPAWFHAMLLLDPRFLTPQGAVLRNGEVGSAAGFAIFVSNNVATGTSTHTTNTGITYKLMAGYPGSIAFAEQVREVECYRPEKRFADAVKGLHLYGAKVVRPQSLGVVVALRPSIV